MTVRRRFFATHQVFVSFLYFLIVNQATTDLIKPFLANDPIYTICHHPRPTIISPPSPTTSQEFFKIFDISRRTATL